MTPKHLSRIWAALGSLLAYYALSAVIVSQGGPALYAKVLYAEVDRIESLFAVVVCSVLLIAVSWIGVAHATGVQNRQWAARVPEGWLEGLDPIARSTRIYQGFFLFVFVLGPLASLFHFLRRFSKATVIDHEGVDPPFSPFCLLSCPDTPHERYIVGDGLTREMVTQQGEIAAGRSVDWFPLWEQWVILGLVGSAGLSVVWFLVSVFRTSFNLRFGR